MRTIQVTAKEERLIEEALKQMRNRLIHEANYDGVTKPHRTRMRNKAKDADHLRLRFTR